MSRLSSDVFVDARLIHGYDYERQAWVLDGRYVDCGHPDRVNCRCYGRMHAGEETRRQERPLAEVCQ